MTSPITYKQKKKLLKMAKEFELMPKFLRQVGLTDNADCVMTKFARDLASGLISRYSAFHNVFNPKAYETDPVEDDETPDRYTLSHLNHFSELDW